VVAPSAGATRIRNRIAKFRPWLWMAIPAMIAGGVGFKVVLGTIHRTIVLNIANTTDSPLSDVHIAYAGRELQIARLEPRQQVMREVRPASRPHFSVRFVDADGKLRSDGFGARFDGEGTLATNDNHPIDVEISKDAQGQLYLKVHRAWLLGDSAFSGTMK
jgi:hypothetical protein